MHRTWLAVALSLIGGAAAFLVYYSGMGTGSALLAEAEGHLRAGRLAEAKVAADARLRDHPDDAAALFLLARADYWRGDLEEAHRQLQRCADLGFNPAACRGLAAALATEARPDGSSEHALRDAARTGTGPEPEITRALVRAEMARYRLGAAQTLLRKWIDLAPWDPTPWVWLADIDRRSMKEKSQAAEFYEKALALDQGCFEARVGLALQLLAAHRNAEAATTFDKALAARPNNTEALLGAGRNAFEMGNLDGAEGYFRRATECAPGQPEGFKRLGAVVFQRGDAGYTKDLLRKALELDPSDQEAQRLLGQALSRLGDTAGAREALAKAEQLRRDDEALSGLRSKVLKDPADVESRAQIVRWLLDHRRPAEAITWSDEVFRLAPDHAETHDLLARYYESVNQPGKANYHRLRSGRKP